MRRSFEESILILRESGVVFEDQSPRLPAAMPQFDDEDPCGISIFRMGMDGDDCRNLEIPRTFFSKSEIANCDFSNTNLSESNLCWNDFISVKFVGADLSSSDLRNSKYQNVDFSLANLSNSDLRHCEFDGCKFTGANMTAVRLTKLVGESLNLSLEQKTGIDWHDVDGEEAAGG